MKNILVVLFLISCSSVVSAQSTSRNTEQSRSLRTRSVENELPSTIEPEQESQEPHFPVITLNGGGGFIFRNEAFGGFGSVGLDFQSDWAYAGLNINVGALGNSPDDVLFTEISGYGHLLAIGVSDVTYRRYIDGDQFRLLAGFSYTKSHQDIVRVDVNLGVDYFNESQRSNQRQEWGLQIGARIRFRVWRFENFLQLSVYQNLEVGTGAIDLSGTEIVCSNFDEVLNGGDLMCVVPERDPEDMGDGLVNWQTTGFLIQERLFLNIHEESDGGRLGPEIELRFERTPLRGFNFWAMISFRYYWSVLSI